MKPYPIVTESGDPRDYLRTVARLRKEDIVEIDNLNNRLVAGRLRTDRIVPTSNADVVGVDMEGDIVRSAAYEYIVVNDAGTLKWARHALDVGW